MVDGYDGRFSTSKTGFESRSSFDFDNLGEWSAVCLQSSSTPVRFRELSRRLRLMAKSPVFQTGR